jgi:CheY-like chemotaxis protein
VTSSSSSSSSSLSSLLPLFPSFFSSSLSLSIYLTWVFFLPCPNRILIVDDNTVNQKVLVWMLEKKGCVCKTANGAQEALSLLEKQRFDIMFTDIRMHPVNGLELTKTIRELEKKEGFVPIPIIGMSGDADSRRALEVGMNDYMPKPFSKDECWRKIGRWGNWK